MPSRRRGPKRTTARDYPRTARLNELLREIIGEELERIDDSRLDVVTDHLGRHRVRPAPGRSCSTTASTARTATRTRWPRSATPASGCRAPSAARRGSSARPSCASPPDPAVRSGARIESVLRRHRPDRRHRARPRRLRRAARDHVDADGRRRRSTTRPATSAAAPLDRDRAGTPDERPDRRCPPDRAADRSRRPAPRRRGRHRQAGGWTSHDVVAKAAGHPAQQEDRPLGHPRPRRHRRARARRGPGDPPAALPHRAARRPTSARSCSGVETSTLDAAGEVTATHDMAGVTLDDVVAAAAGPHRRHPADPADGVGGQDRRQAPARARPRGQGGRARAAAGHGPPLRRRGGRRASRCVFRVEVDCSSGTYIRTLAADLGHALGGGAHLRPCGAPRSGRSASTRPARSRRSRSCRARGAAGLPGRRRARRDPRPRCATARCSPSTELGVPDAVLPPARVVDRRPAPGRSARSARGRCSTRSATSSPCTSPTARSA